MIDFDCPQCGKRYSVDDDMGGAHAWCEACKGLLIVPQSSEGPPAERLTLEEQVEFLRDLLRSAEQRFRKREERFQKTNEMAQVLYNRYKELRTKYQERGERIASDEARIEEAKAHVKRMARGLVAAAEAQGRAEARLARALEDLDRAAMDLTEERNARIRLEEQIAQSRMDSMNLQAAEKAREELARRLQEAEAENGRLREQMAAMSQGPEADRVRREGLERELERLLQDLDAERRARTEAEKAARAAHAQALRLEDRLARTQQDLERTQPHVERLAVLEQEIEAFRARLNEAGATMTSLRQDLERMTHARGEAEGRFEQAQAEARRLAQELQALQLEKDEAAARLREFEARAAQAEIFQQDRDEVQRLLRKAEADLEIFKAQMALNSQDSGGAELRAAEALQEAERLREELENERSRVAEARRTAHECRLRAERAEAEWHSLETTVKELRERLAAVEGGEAAAGEARARVVELEGVVDRLTAELRSVSQTMGALQTHADHLEKEVERLNAERRSGVGAAESGGRKDAETRGPAGESGFVVFPRADDDGLTFVAELVDEAEDAEDDMMKNLLRFIEPEQ